MATSRVPVSGPDRASAPIPAAASTAATTISSRNRSTSIATSSQTKYAASGIQVGSTMDTTKESAISPVSTRAADSWLSREPVRHASMRLRTDSAARTATFQAYPPAYHPPGERSTAACSQCWSSGQRQGFGPHTVTLRMPLSS
jgi:hypothetical protein